MPVAAATRTTASFQPSTLTGGFETRRVPGRSDSVVGSRAPQASAEVRRYGESSGSSASAREMSHQLTLRTDAITGVLQGMDDRGDRVSLRAIPLGRHDTFKSAVSQLEAELHSVGVKKLDRVAAPRSEIVRGMTGAVDGIARSARELNLGSERERAAIPALKSTLANQLGSLEMLSLYESSRVGPRTINDHQVAIGRTAGGEYLAIVRASRSPN